MESEVMDTEVKVDKVTRKVDKADRKVDKAPDETGPFYLVTAQEFMSTLISDTLQCTLYPGCSVVLNGEQWSQFSTIPLGSFSYQEIDAEKYYKYKAGQGLLGFNL